MASSKGKLKSGMGGSRSGKGRYEPTEVLKKGSKKPRRQQDRQEVVMQCSCHNHNKDK